MLAFRSPYTNPYMNLAAEEYFLRNFPDDFFITYRNSPSVIVGKHQNALGEVDIHYLRQHEIQLARRISGGGAVYHDPGNMNFTFIRNATSDNRVDFTGFTRPIIDFLKTFGVEARLGGHNSIMIGNFKVSGNAEHIFRNRVLHHGTLLFSTDLEVLAACLYTQRERYSDRAIRSVRAQVANIRELMRSPMSAAEFEATLFEFVTHRFGASSYQLSQNDICKIEQLVLKKYSTPQWVLGYSPLYEKTIRFSHMGEALSFTIHVENGTIKSLEAQQPHWLLEELDRSLTGTLHEPAAVLTRINAIGLPVKTADELMFELF